MTAGPQLSAIVVTPAGFDVIRKTVSHLRAQEDLGTIELIVVAPSREALGDVGDAFEGFWGHEVVETGPLTTSGRAIGAGVSVARAPVSAYVEEHSYPEPGWAAALVDAHAGPWAAVGMSIANANPESMVSWAMLFLDFAPAVELKESGEATALPPHHTAYKRAALEGHDAELHRLLEVEAALHAALIARGDRLYAEHRARRMHVNVSKLGSMLSSQYYGGRQYAPLRGFSRPRRLAYAAAAPLIVLVQLRRLLGHVRRAGLSGELLPRVLPPLVLGLAAEQAGETVGYLVGRQGTAPEKRLSIELDRAAHVR